MNPVAADVRRLNYRVEGSEPPYCRQEYAWVPNAIFASKRAEILRRFLSRDPIFVTEWFRNKYERQVRQNLEVSLSKLSELSR